MKAYPSDEILARVSCHQIAQQEGLVIADQHCAAPWRGSDNPKAVHIREDEWTDCETGEKGNAIELLARLKYSGDIRKANEALGLEFGLKNLIDITGELALREAPDNKSQYTLLVEKGWSETARFDYHDAHGGIVAQAVVLRFEKKEKRLLRDVVRQSWHAKELVPPIYNLPGVLTAGSVVVTESEHDANLLIKMDLQATTCFGGLGHWKQYHCAALRNKTVVVCHNNNAVGKRWTGKVLETLQGIAAEIRLICPAQQPGGTLADYLDAGGTMEGILERIKTAPICHEPSSEDHARPGISLEFLQMAEVAHVDAEEARVRCELSEPGFWIPYRDLLGNDVLDRGQPYGRLRLDTPRNSKKYHQVQRSTVHLYVPPGLAESDSSDLAIIEGEFKAMALMEPGFAAVGISGFFGWGKGKKTDAGGEAQLLDELLDVIAQVEPQRIYFCGDSDTALNWQFSLATTRLRAALPETIELALPRIPLDGPKGADDRRESLGDDFRRWWYQRLSEAIRVGPCVCWEELAIALLSKEVAALKTLAPSEMAKAKKQLAVLSEKFNASAWWEEFTVACEQAGFSRSMLSEMARKQKKRTQENLRVKRQEALKDSMSQANQALPGIAEQRGPAFVITESGKPGALNESYFAELFRRRRQQQVLWEPSEALFYVYDGKSGLWIPESVDAIKAHMDDEMLAFFKDHFAEHADDLASRRTDSRSSAIVNKLKGYAELPDAFNQRSDHKIVHVANGVLDLNDGTLKDFSPRWMSRNQVPFDYDEGAECPRFINELLRPHLAPEDIDLLQRWCGMVLVGGNPFQRLMILTGAAGAGKGTLCEVIEGVIGRRNVTTLRTELLHERFEQSAYIGKRLLCGKNVPGDFLQRKGASNIKALVGHDWLETEAKYANRRTSIRGEFDILIVCNSRLCVRLDGDVEAWRRRLLIVGYNHPPQYTKRIANFAGLLLKDEGNGILRWMIQGAVKALQHATDCRSDFELTATQNRRVDDLLAESESLRTFVRSCVRQAKGKDLSTAELLGAYVEFCSFKDWVPISKTRFEKGLADIMLQEHKVHKRNDIKRDGQQRGYAGVTLLPMEDEPCL